MSNFTNIPSDIRSFFNEKRRSAVMNAFTCLLEDINLDCRSLGGMKRENCRLTNLQVFQILVLFPFFAIKGYSHYAGSALSRMFGGKKDMFYSYLSQDNINWRKVIYCITNQLVKRVVIRDDHKKSRLPKVLIADDTDLPKTGMHMESIDKIFSHVHQKCILGYKALMLCWSNGRTQFMLDFMRAYEIYAMRWSIEVFFSDSKRILGLADCSSRDFSAHIAHVSLVMIRFNMLSAIKRTLDYDTIGGLFENMYLGVHELTVVEKIWAIIIEVVAVVAELIEADSEVLTLQVINSDKRLAVLRAYALTA